MGLRILRIELDGSLQLGLRFLILAYPPQRLRKFDVVVVIQRIQLDQSLPELQRFFLVVRIDVSDRPGIPQQRWLVIRVEFQRPLKRPDRCRGVSHQVQAASKCDHVRRIPVQFFGGFHGPSLPFLEGLLIVPRHLGIVKLRLDGHGQQDVGTRVSRVQVDGFLEPLDRV